MQVAVATIQGYDGTPKVEVYRVESKEWREFIREHREDKRVVDVEVTEVKG